MFKGSNVALITPFKNNKVDEEKYIKIITDTGNQKSVWVFINAKEFKKGLAGITFQEGDILKAAGWKTPALNAPRGNILRAPYPIIGMRQYGPDYLR